MASGCPVVCSRSGALPEVAGEHAVYVEPLDEESILEGLVELLQDRERAESLRRQGPAHARKFTWQAAALATLEVYRRALAARG